MKKFLACICCLLGMICTAQQGDIVDFIRIEAQVEPMADEQSVQGTVVVTYKMLSDRKSVYLDAVDMEITEYLSLDVTVVSRENRIWLSGNYKTDSTYTARFSYKATPRQTLYFTGDQIWTQGQGKYTSHWLPSLDDMNDKIEFDLTVVAPQDRTVVANGSSTDVTEESGKKHWAFNMEKPMSSYLVALAIGNFEKTDLTTESGKSLSLYYRPEAASMAEPTYRYTKEIYEFLEDEIGVPYPWQNYKQAPVRDFLYAGMENTTFTIFSEAFVVDSIGFNDRNYVNVNAHELAHQWFGNLVTETSGTHHWLHEGFATYYALLAERELFGDDYYYWKLYQTAERLKELSDSGKGEALLNPKASSLTFYEKGAWALHILREQVGDNAFRLAVQQYLEKFSYKNVTTSDFLADVAEVSGQDMTEFEKDWLKQSAFKAEQAYQSLVKSEFMKEYFEISALRSAALKDKQFALLGALKRPNDFIGQEVIYQLIGEPIAESLSVYEAGLKSNNLFVRQAIANTLGEVPVELKAAYESLLKDDSYVTREAALFNLWTSFPEDRQRYLDTLDNQVGFGDKNIRQLWLVLALVTEGYRDTAKPGFLEELKGYTSPNYSFEIREIALGYLSELQVFSEDVLRNLINACVHHNWRFRNAARGILNEVLKTETHKSWISSSFDSFSEKEKAFLNKKLTE